MTIFCRGWRWQAERTQTANPVALAATGVSLATQTVG